MSVEVSTAWRFGVKTQLDEKSNPIRCHAEVFVELEPGSSMPCKIASKPSTSQKQDTGAHQRMMYWIRI